MSKQREFIIKIDLAHLFSGDLYDCRGFQDGEEFKFILAKHTNPFLYLKGKKMEKEGSVYGQVRVSDSAYPSCSHMFKDSITNGRKGIIEESFCRFFYSLRIDVVADKFDSLLHFAEVALKDIDKKCIDILLIEEHTPEEYGHTITEQYDWRKGFLFHSSKGQQKRVEETESAYKRLKKLLVG